MKSKFIIGTDIGGTFTDTVVMDSTGEISFFKVPSSPADNTKGVLGSIDLASKEMGLSHKDFLATVDTFYHGTTVGMNAVLTRQGSKVGFITTRGFKDTLPMMRASRISSFDIMKMDMPSLRDETTLIPIHLIKEVTERIDFSGQEIAPLDMEELKTTVKELVDKGVEAIGVCLLWSIRNPDHESQIKNYINEKYPELFVSISSEVMPVIREYERSVVTLINSYIAKIIERYLAKLENSLRKNGLESPLLVMQSTGGALSVEEALRRPSQLFLSGPAGGLIGSLFLGDALGHKNILTMDMGGTSCDIGVIVDGRSTVVTRSKLAEYDAALPKLDINTIGAGGGSIAWIDHGILLRVGPHSAGAEPGPACYNRGGREPTVTDANVVLGYIDPDHFLDGRMTIRRDLAEGAIINLGAQLGLTMIETAVGIIEVTNSNMVNAIRAMTVERGHDPRDFVMMCFGGAGPLHAGALKAELGIPVAIIPYTATAHSAYGFVCSDICHNLVISRYFRNPENPIPFNEIYSELEQKGRECLTGEGVPEQNMVFKRYVDLRYCGQVFEITIDVPLKTIEKGDLADFMDAFEVAYENKYGKGTGWKEAGIEVINFRLDAIGKMLKPTLKKYPIAGGDEKVALKGMRSCFFSKSRGFIPTSVYDGDVLLSGMIVNGPAVIMMHSTSTIVEPGQEAYIDEYRNVIIRN
jgi:N-methylhydantoinase A